MCMYTRIHVMQCITYVCTCASSISLSLWSSMHQEHLPLLHLLRGHVLCVDDVVVIRDDQDHLLYGGHRRGCVEMYAWCYVMCNVTCTVTCITTKVRACVCMHIWYTMVYHACTLRARNGMHYVMQRVASCASCGDVCCIVRIILWSRDHDDDVLDRHDARTSSPKSRYPHTLLHVVLTRGVVIQYYALCVCICIVYHIQGILLCIALCYM
jgi:hypothetical protein